MTPVALLRAYSPGHHHEHWRRESLLAEPLSFAEEFDGVLFHLGRWPYEHVAERFEVLATRQLDRYANGGTRDQWDSDQAAILDLFEFAGWTWEEFDAEMVRRIEAKLT